MNIIKYKDITIILESKSNHCGFKHIATLIYGYSERLKTSIQYYNRTWERFTYESIINKIINIQIENIERLQKTIYKESNNIKRLTKEKEKEVLKVCDSIEFYKQLKALKTKIKKCNSLYQLQK